MRAWVDQSGDTGAVEEKAMPGKRSEKKTMALAGFTEDPLFRDAEVFLRERNDVNLSRPKPNHSRGIVARMEGVEKTPF